MVTEAVAEVLGGKRAVRCKVVAPTESDSASRPKSKTDQAKTDPLVRHAIDELGGRIAGVKPPTEQQ
jgi:hypothetical protein